MKNNHVFIFEPRSWLGEGKIVLNMVEEELSFYTKWTVQAPDAAGKIRAIQEIQIHGISEMMRNELVFYDFTPKGFSVEMENMNIGKVLGTGIYSKNIFAWEFRGNEMNFEGFESYQLMEDGTYAVHSEYVSSDQFRTQIKGKIWLPATEQNKGVNP